MFHSFTHVNPDLKISMILVWSFNCFKLCYLIKKRHVFIYFSTFLRVKKWTSHCSFVPNKLWELKNVKGDMHHLILNLQTILWPDEKYGCWNKYSMNYCCSYSLLLIYFWSIHTVVSEEKNQFLKKNQCQFSSLWACLWLTVYRTSAMEIMILFFWLHYHTFLSVWKCSWGLLWNRLEIWVGSN